MKLLMHACCAPCSVYCVETLRKEGIEPTMFWYNPNIHTYFEYKSRLDCFKDYCKKMNLQSIIIDEYGLEDFCKNTSNDIENRCTNYCYPKRLSKLFSYAKENGYDTVSTTLLYSIYQKHDFIKNFCEKLSSSTNINFLYRDFRVGFWEGHEKAIELGLYMQKYCGCIFSQADAEYYHKKTVPSLPDGFEKTKRTSLEVKKIEDANIIKEFLKEKDYSINNKCNEIDIKKENINNNEKNNNSLINLENLKIYDIFGIQKNGKTISIIILRKQKNYIEIEDLITLNEYRNKGFGTKLLKSMQGNYKQKYKYMIIGTIPQNLPYYIEQGFNEFVKQENEILYYKKTLF